MKDKTNLLTHNQYFAGEYSLNITGITVNEFAKLNIQNKYSTIGEYSLNIKEKETNESYAHIGITKDINSTKDTIFNFNANILNLKKSLRIEVWSLSQDDNIRVNYIDIPLLNEFKNIILTTNIPPSEKIRIRAVYNYKENNFGECYIDALNLTNQ